MNVLRLERLNKAFGSLVVTDDVNFTVAPGERHVIIGPNGAGKTSLVNQIGGQLQPAPAGYCSRTATSPGRRRTGSAAWAWRARFNAITCSRTSA